MTREQELLFSAFTVLLEHTPDLIFIKDADLCYVDASASFAELTGRSRARLHGCTDFDLFPEALAQCYRTNDRTVMESRAPSLTLLEPLPSPDGSERFSSTCKYAILDQQGQAIGLCGIGYDISLQQELSRERERSEQLRLRAMTDPLTGLLNRRYTIECIRDAISGCGADDTHALLFLDLDRFKQINDTLGHPSGDRVLQELAKRLRSLFRGSDIIGRFGGDEFLILLRNVSAETAKKKIDHIFKQLTLACREGGQDVQITCSIGVAIYAGGKTFEQLYKEADQAMYRAKNQGKNRVEFYEQLHTNE